jgi:hypothetical protein
MRPLMRFLAAGVLIVTSAGAEEMKLKDGVVSIEPMTFYSGQRNRYAHRGQRMDCPTAADRPAGSRDKWLESLCGDKANRKSIVKQLGASYPGGWCGYARYAVACVVVP